MGKDRDEDEDFVKIAILIDKVNWFIDRNQRLPSADGEHDEKVIAEFVDIAEQWGREHQHPPPHRYCGVKCMLILRFLDRLHELKGAQEMLAQKVQAHKIEGGIRNSESRLKTHVSSSSFLSNGQSEGMTKQGAIALGQGLRFLEELRGEEMLSTRQIEVMERVEKIIEYLESAEYISDVDHRILAQDLLIQRNLFRQDDLAIYEDNLAKYWDDSQLFERAWEDPSSPDLRPDYFWSIPMKMTREDPNAIIPGLIVFGFDVDDNFNPILKEDEGLINQLVAMRNCTQNDIVFFVSRSKIWFLRWGSRSDEFKIVEEGFSDFWDFCGFVTKAAEDNFSECSDELFQFYSSLEQAL